MDQNNLTQIINKFIGVNLVYEFNNTILKSSTDSKNISILEFYQYEIVNHPIETSVDNPLEYDSLSDNESECSIYSYSNEENVETKKSSCDIITNGSEIIFNENIEYYYQYLQNLYKIAKLKNNNILNDKDTLSKIIFPYKVVLNLISEYERIFDHLIKFKNCEENKIQITNFNSNNYVNHIKKINTNNNEKFICIGDVHGSIHTFIRLLFRFHKYGILNLKTMKIIEPYNIVFLGDVIDRGLWGLEITCTLIILLINNPERMHWNSGNHEDKKINLNSGFGLEIYKKYIHFKSISETAILYNSLNKFFGYLSCAIIIHNVDSNKKYWLAHGGIPQKIINDTLVEPDIPFNKLFYSFNSVLKTWEFSPENETSGYYLVNDETAFTAKWSDFPYNGFCTRSSNLKCTSYEYFMNFMSKYGINGIIRGHQDSISNSLVYKKEIQSNSKVIFNQSELYETKKLNNIYWNDRKDDIKKTRFYGPLARLHIDIFTVPDDYTDDIIQPVVTLSTNTDKGRNLTADSFGLLRFDIEPDHVRDFGKNLLESKNKIIHLNNQELELFKQKYLKYKIKYIKLKKQIKM